MRERLGRPLGIIMLLIFVGVGIDTVIPPQTAYE